ncbi:MAG TPA: hypothetical protein IAA29_11730 [Candidatus Paenibacillus intestinavium]|nr:hypothetical protein [Candidatus Paenibacillus intestinavium]
MNIRYILYLIVGLVILCLTVSLSSVLIITYFNADRDWLGALIASLGNIIGGVLGAFIAYFVARYQIEITQKNNQLSVKKELDSLALIVKEELKNNSLTLTSMINTNEVIPSLIKYQMTKEAWVLFSSKHANSIDEILFVSLNTVYRKITLLRSIPYEEISGEITIEELVKLKNQVDECVRKIDEVIKASK